jgi:hypothetical protein
MLAMVSSLSCCPDESEQVFLVRAEEPETVLKDFRCHPQFVGRLEGGVGPFEDVDEGIPVNELPGCEWTCCLFFAWFFATGVAEVDVCELVGECASSFDL